MHYIYYIFYSEGHAQSLKCIQIISGREILYYNNNNNNNNGTGITMILLDGNLQLIPCIHYDIYH